MTARRQLAIALAGRTLTAFAVALVLAWGAIVGSPTRWLQLDYSPTRSDVETGAGDAPPPTTAQDPPPGFSVVDATPRGTGVVQRDAVTGPGPGARPATPAPQPDPPVGHRSP